MDINLNKLQRNDVESAIAIYKDAIAQKVSESGLGTLTSILLKLQDNPTELLQKMHDISPSQ